MTISSRIIIALSLITTIVFVPGCNQKEDAINLVNYIERRFSWLDYYSEDLTIIKPFFATQN